MKTMSLRAFSRTIIETVPTVPVYITLDGVIIGQFRPLAGVVDPSVALSSEPPRVIKDVKLQEVSLVEDAAPLPGGTTAIRDGQYSREFTPAPKPTRKKRA